MSRGVPTPVKALADAIDRIYELQFPALFDGAVVNVGQVHGGEIFNSIPQELYFTVDLRSPDPVLLDSLDRTITRLVREASDREKVGLRVEFEQRNQAGGTTRQLAGARALAASRQPGLGHRHLDVLERGQGRDEVMHLKHEADRSAAEAVQVAHAAERLPVDDHLALSLIHISEPTRPY